LTSLQQVGAPVDTSQGCIGPISSTSSLLMENNLTHTKNERTQHRKESGMSITDAWHNKSNHVKELSPPISRWYSYSPHLVSGVVLDNALSRSIVLSTCSSLIKLCDECVVVWQMHSILESSRRNQPFVHACTTLAPHLMAAFSVSLL